MSKIDEVKAELTKQGIAFDEEASLKDLRALLPEGDEGNEDEIVVRDPMVLRPVSLPLVVTLPDGASKAQIEFAKVLNAYAYQNPEKWAIKKDDKIVDGKNIKGLISKLKDLKNAPDPIENPNLRVGSKLTV